MQAVALVRAGEAGTLMKGSLHTDELMHAVVASEAGNMLAKQLSFLAGAGAAGVVLGAKVPIILTSRADSQRTRIASCAVAVLQARSAVSTMG